MPRRRRRPLITVDRALLAALVTAVVLATTAGHGGSEATTPTVEEPAANVAVDVIRSSAPPVVNLPAGSATVTASAGATTAAPTTAAPATAAPAPAPVSAPVPTKWLPSGKGMWIYEPGKTEGGNVAAIVAKAKATGLTHLWVRMGSAWDGFNVAPFVDRLLPVAHAAGIRVIGWDFPKLEPWEADVSRALTMVRHTTPSGDRIDAFSADIETRFEGTRLTAEAARRYGAALREGVGVDYPLIATVPRPSKEKAGFPYADVVADYDAIAPMIYWLDRQPDSDVAGALRDLAQFGKPIYPVGQAYDGAPEGGRKGVPPPEELLRFMRFAQSHGAAGVSFWSWQAANQPAWSAIREAVEFRLPEPTAGAGAPAH